MALARTRHKGTTWHSGGVPMRVYKCKRSLTWTFHINVGMLHLNRKVKGIIISLEKEFLI